jgi:monoamine oxidase
MSSRPAESLPLTMANYQILIVGAGMAGLHCAMRLSERNPHILIAVAEAYNYVGGRCFTYKDKSKDLAWESGAGRIHSSHAMVTHYVDKYKLTKIPLPTQEDWLSSKSHTISPNIWEGSANMLVDTLLHLDKKTLATRTIEEILIQTYGEKDAKNFLKRFAYRSEVNTMRADLALKSLANEMGSAPSFYVVKEGLSELASRMRKTLEDRGVKFLLGHRLSAIEPRTTPIVCKFTKTTLKADKVILALHSEALRKINPFANLPVLKHLKMQPLLRTYGVFPKDSFQQGLHKTVTDSPLRFIIPINQEKGIVMTSYTDGDDTKPWVKILQDKGENGLKTAIVSELSRAFPGKNTRPTYFKSHLWNDGCTYWTPGLYDPEELSEKVMKPIPNSWQQLYVCGESFSLRQAWIEGALEHSDKLINKFF